jgi:hypothetical protein
MDTFIQLPAAQRREICEQGFAKLNLAAVSIEKDFWVCWTLRELFHLPVWGEQLTFKGGTSLSKGWRLISRFSEDIDIVIERDFLGFGDEILSHKRQNKLLKECNRRIQEELRPALDKRMRELLPLELGWKLIPAGAEEDPDLQTILFQYPSVFSDGLTYIRPVVKIELGSRSETEPVELPVIKPYLAEAFPDLFKKSHFSLRTVAARRTFWEKAMLLHEETFRPADKPRRARLSRHYYDLWCLIRAGIATQAMADTDLFDRVVRHRQIFFKQSWVDYDTLRKGSLRITPRPQQLADWRRDYETMRKEMFFEEPPTFEEIMTTVRQFEEEINNV